MPWPTAGNEEGNMNTDTRPRILVVDDEAQNLKVMKKFLSEHFSLFFSKSGPGALAIARENPPDLILLDIVMPEMNGLEVCAHLKSDPRTEKIPVIFVTARNDIDDEAHGFAAGGVDYITKPVNPAILSARIRTHLALYDQNRSLEDKVKEQTGEIFQTRLEIIQRLGRAAEYKDNETGHHIMRISHYCRILAREYGLDRDTSELIFQASPMHDIGKIGIPDHILLKPGRLNEEEWKIMKSHAEIGARIIGRHASRLLQYARIIALSHHEKWDGTGYPKGLAGEDIPLLGRVVAIADVYDALITERVYKKAWPVDKAVNYIRDNAGVFFDPQLVDCFMTRLSDIRQIKTRYPEPVPPPT
jgi:putative two-component system response regulator